MPSADSEQEALAADAVANEQLLEATLKRVQGCIAMAVLVHKNCVKARQEWRLMARPVTAPGRAPMLGERRPRSGRARGSPSARSHGGTTRA